MVGYKSIVSKRQCCQCSLLGAKLRFSWSFGYEGTLNAEEVSEDNERSDWRTIICQILGIGAAVFLFLGEAMRLQLLRCVDS